VSRILVLGGTRFVGRLTAMRLAEAGNDVTVLSRRAGDIPGARRIVADRAAGIASLGGNRFDAVLDFIAYDESGCGDACGLGHTYVAISSTWLPRLSGAAADAVVPADDSRAPASMLAVTRKYLLGKARLEADIRERRAAGLAATAVRLPILMGDGDHTGRLEFYRTRIADGGGVLMIDGGLNTAQILWSEDAARALTVLIGAGTAGSRALWEALPDAGHRVVDFVAQVARAMKADARLVAVPKASVDARLGGYLESEPLWRESALARTPANLFTNLGLTATAPADWLPRVPRAKYDAGATRAAEVALAGALA
jgi:2'-hydroxyisoflavone reductase